jgi:RNA polymerase sigma-70 factor (ECF subfamily)
LSEVRDVELGISLARPHATERFDELVWPHAAVVARTALFLTHNPAEADDLAQETLIKAFKALDRFQEGTDMRAWLLAILRNTRIDRIRAQGGRSMAALDADIEDSAQPVVDHSDLWSNPEAMLEEFSDEHMIRALQGLPEDIRWTLLLVDVEGLDQGAAAAILGVPVGTVKSRLHRGRSMLRNELAPTARELRQMNPGGRG